MFLTRFAINPARRAARKLLGSPHAMHGAVCASFPPSEVREHAETRTLWRLDQPNPATVHLYIASAERPDLTHLVEQAGWPTNETATWETRSYDRLLDSLAEGQQWAFRLTANPVHNGRRHDEAKQTQRYGRIRESEQVDWLVSRTERHGFAVTTQSDGGPNVTLRSSRKITFRRGPGEVTLVIATFDGVLEIVDVASLRRTLTAGMGHAKAYGCGLLTLAPAR